MSTKGGGYVRVKDCTQIAVRKLMGKIQQQHGSRRITADDALWYAIEKAEPEIAKESIVESDQESFEEEDD